MTRNTLLPPLVVRADADSLQGTGHVMRCLALARAWHVQGGLVQFITAQPTPALWQRIESAGAEVIRLAQPYPQATDLDVTRFIIDRAGRDSAFAPWLVSDGYHFTPDYQSAIRRTGCRLLVIDDNAHLASYNADILLNHGVQAPRLNYPDIGDAWPLLGTRYALLRAEFERWRDHQRTISKTAKNILITLGGSDPDNTTAKVLDALSMIGDHRLNIKVLVGAFNAHLEDLRRRGAATANVELHSDVTDPAPMMAWADIAIAAAGTTAWELAFMQTPALLLVAAENQTNVASGIAEFAAGQSLGRAETLCLDDIADALRRLIAEPERRRLMALRGRALVDGGGAARVLAAMKERQRFSRQNEFTIRRAVVGDEMLLWQWANDPSTRRNSFSSAAISWDDHQAWCAKKFAAPDCRLWIMQVGDLPVAQIRYDRVVSDIGAVAEISFSVAPGFRGLQLGTRLLAATVPLVVGELDVASVEGVALPGNEASYRAFLKAGFVAAEARRIDGRLCTVFRRDYHGGSWSDCHVNVH